MKKILLFISSLIKEINKNSIFSMANDLTFKMILSIFPLIIFIMTIIGYLEIDASYLYNKLSLPNELNKIIENFITEIFYTKRSNLLTSSLLISIISASSGFRALIYGINKIYNTKETRNFIKITLISIVFVFIFSILIISFLIVLIFNNYFILILEKYNIINKTISYIYNLIGYVIVLILMIFSTIIINKIAIAKKVNFISLIPGSSFTIISWIIISKLFNLYINNFSKMSTIYGSVAGIMISMIWINIICSVLLIGTQINALISKKINKITY